MRNIFVKKAVYLDGGIVIAVKYNLKNNRVMIVGMPKDRPAMVDLVIIIFKHESIPHNTHTNNKRLKFDFKLSLVKFKKGVDVLEDVGQIMDVKNFGRLLG